MSLNPLYLDQIKGFEGYTEQPQWDFKQYSSGYGTKAQPGEVIDQAEAEKRFSSAIDQAAAHVDSINPNLPPGVRAALTSLTYNAGPGWAQSGLGEAIKAGDLEKARGIFPQYNKAGGEVNNGLVARRGKELTWWDGQPQPPQATPAGPANGLLPQSIGGLMAQQAGGLLQPPVFSANALGGSPGATQSATLQASDLPQLPQMQMQPIMYAKPRQPDLRSLQAALKRPIFAKG